MIRVKTGGVAMAVISGSHALLTNLVMAWNTHHMQTTLDGWTKEKKIIPDDGLARISPAHTGHINFPVRLRARLSRIAISCCGRRDGLQLPLNHV